MVLNRTQADEVGGGPAAPDPPTQQHAAQELRLAAGEEASPGKGAQASRGDHPGDHFEEAAGEEGGGEPAGGHQGEPATTSPRSCCNMHVC